MGIWELKLSQTLGSQECNKTNPAGNNVMADTQRILRRISFPMPTLTGSVLPTFRCKHRNRVTFYTGAVPMAILNGKYEVAISKEIGNI